MTIAQASIFIATHNLGKLRELRRLLGENVTVLSAADIEIDLPDETGETFAANALLKARHGFQATRNPTIADDSGLEVDALHGLPGVRSARYAGERATDDENCEKLLAALDGVPSERRSARFVCAIAIVGPSLEHVVEGSCHGSIAVMGRGSNGFGYDPLFTLPDGRTMAELRSDEKSRISHRAQAMRLVAPILRTLTSGSDLSRYAVGSTP